METQWDLVVIGGGAAGFFGAIHCQELNPSLHTVILEKGNRVLSKVLVSGGGRCNLTHACFDPQELVKNYPRGSKALLGPLTRFGPTDTIAWFRRHGVALKTEADGRVFPASNSSQTIIDCLQDQASRSGIVIRTRAPVESLSKSGSGSSFILCLRDGETIRAQKILLASGGDRGGFGLAQSLGHTIIPPAPSLFTFQIPDSRLEGLAGVSVEDVEVSLPAGKLKARGPLLVTHWGLSGPAVLRLSAWGARLLQEANYRMEIRVNWLPEFHQESLAKLLLTQKEKSARMMVSSHDPTGKLPLRLWKRLAASAGIGEEQTWADLSRRSLSAMTDQLLQGVFTLQGRGVFKEEFVTCGGVSLDEVDFRTMESKVCPGLYLAGEVLDIDGLTGGFNFQSAWTTAWLAGEELSKKKE